MIILLFFIIQCILSIWLAFHDLLFISPFNTVNTVIKLDTKQRLLGSILNLGIIIIPTLLMGTVISAGAAFFVIPFWMLCNLGAAQWWASYLDARGIDPTALNISKYMLLWLASGIALYLLLTRVR